MAVNERSTYPLRLIVELKREVERKAKANGRSINSEICLLIQESLNMSNTEIQQTLDAMQESGMVIVGREHIEGLAAKDARKPTELIPALMSIGRIHGIDFYQDQAKFNSFEFARKLGELGFDQDRLSPNHQQFATDRKRLKKISKLFSR